MNIQCNLYIKTTPGTNKMWSLSPYTQVVIICGLNSMESIHLGDVKYGHCKQVVFIYRWSLEQI